MPRFSLKMFCAIVALAAVLLLPFSQLVRHSSPWNPAERTEKMLKELLHEAWDSGQIEITDQIIDELLRLPKYKFLYEIRDDSIPLKEGEIAWFSPNYKYSIGLKKNGQIHWIVDDAFRVP